MDPAPVPCLPCDPGDPPGDVVPCVDGVEPAVGDWPPPGALPADVPLPERVEPCAGAPLLEALPAGALLPAGLPPDVPLLGVPPLEPDAPPWLCWEGNGDSWPPPPWLELCPLLWPWPVLGLPPDEDGEFDGEPDDGDEGEDEGVDGLGIWGMDDDWVELVIEQPASASAQAAGQTRPSMVRLRIATISRAHRQSGRRKAPAPFMV